MEIIHGSVTWYQQKIGSYDKQLWEQSVEQKVLKGIKQAPRRSVKPKTALIDVDLVRGSTFSKAKPQVPWSYITLKTFSRVVLFPCHYRWWIQQTSVPFWLSLTFLYILQIFTICVFVSSVEEEVFTHEHSLTEVFIPCILMVLLGLIHSQTVLTHLKPPVRDNKRVLHRVKSQSHITMPGSKWWRKTPFAELPTRARTSIWVEPVSRETYSHETNKPSVLMQMIEIAEGWRRKRSLSQTKSSNDLLINNTVFNTGTVGSDGNSSQSKTNLNLKSASGSRVLRERKKERTKDRKVRLKGVKSSRSGVIRTEHISQDSESAYHTHEDSMVDRGSSADLDSNGSQNKSIHDDGNQIALNKTKTSNAGSSTSKQVEVIAGGKSLRESQESDLPEDSNSDDDDGINKAATSDKDSSNRFSQSISSDNELDLEAIVNASSGKEAHIVNNGEVVSALSNDSINSSNTKEDVSRETLTSNSVIDSVSLVSDVLDTGTDTGALDTGAVEAVKGGVNTKERLGSDRVNSTDLSLKVRIEGKSHLSRADLEKNVPDKNNLDDRGSAGKKSHLSLPKSIGTDKTVDNSINVTDNNETLFKNLASRKVSLRQGQIGPVNKAHISGQTGLKESENYDRTLQCTSLEYSSMSSLERVPAHIASSVHFTLDKQRDITPGGSSREGTPTHTQSDVLLQAKRARGGDLCTKSSDSESDNEKACNTLPNVRRRKATPLEGSEVGVSILRNRRQPSLGLRESKSSPTMVSSSDGETEGQSSEYSREGRKNMASSEEWGDHLQSGLDTTTCSSCGSEPEISAQGAPESETEPEVPASPQSHSTSSSTAHVINLLHPSSSQSCTHSPPDKVTCIIWEGNECKKIELTAIDIGWAIIEKVHKIPESSDYVLIGITFSIIMGLTPLLYHSFHAKDLSSIMTWDGVYEVLEVVLRSSWKENLLHINGVIQRLCLSAIFFFMLSVADKTFKQRLLYAKHFCYLTSSRRARKFDMPHFRLNKVRNIRTWLSLRSYLKKRGPQRSVDVIVSSSFLITLIMLILICLQLLRDTEIYLNYLCNWELLAWCMALGVYLLRFMNLGLRINKKYRNLSVLITEQINLYLQMEQKPHKKEELLVANNVLKLAESLLKELESPFKISGISANPLVLNVTRVVVLSAFSAVLTELLGFKLKLYKIKLRP